MPVVEIKGTGQQAKFPDDMPIDSIKAFLRKKFGSPSDALRPLEPVAQEVKPGLAERAGQGLSDLLYDNNIISDRYGAQRIGGNLSSIGEALPFTGDAAAGDEFGRAAAQGDKSGMLLAGLGAIPIAGDALKKGTKWYHGTNKQFDDFNTDTTFITDNEKLAYIYSRQDLGQKGRVFEVEHDVPDDLIFDTNKPEHRKIFNDKFYRKWGGGGPLSDKGYPDWTDAEDFKQFFEESGLPFKGVKIQEPQGDISLAITDVDMVRPAKGSGKAMSDGGIKSIESPFKSTFPNSERLTTGNAHIDIAESKWSPTKYSIVEFLTGEADRGKGYGSKLMDEAIAKYGSELSGAFSSKESIAMAYKKGFRPLAEEYQGMSVGELIQAGKNGSVTMSYSGKN